MFNSSTYFLHFSLFFGNIFVFFEFGTDPSISDSTRNIVAVVLLVVACIGIVFLCILQPAPRMHSDLGEERDSPLSALQKSANLFITKDMLLLAGCFLYTGNFGVKTKQGNWGDMPKIHVTWKFLIRSMVVCVPNFRSVLFFVWPGGVT